MQPRPSAAVLLACVLASPLHASAFSDPELYAAPTDLGGGAGRQFTGSPVDGLSCSVCHQGGPEPTVTIDGLPDHFEPGTRYSVTVSWVDDPEISHALQLELASKSGAHAQVTLPPKVNLPRRARCDGDERGAPAVYSLDVGERRVLGVLDCGASELRFDFTPPDEPELYFAAGVVQSDSSGSTRGDGVHEIRRVLLRRGESAASSGCRAGGTEGGSNTGVALGALLLAFAIRRQRWWRRAPRALRPTGTPGRPMPSTPRRRHVRARRTRDSDTA